MSRITVETAPMVGGWRARVTIVDHGTSRIFEVVVTDAELGRFAPGATEPADLVRRSFEFLLSREPKESILSSFDLSTIVRYFPNTSGRSAARCRSRRTFGPWSARLAASHRPCVQDCVASGFARAGRRRWWSEPRPARSRA